MRIGVSVSVDSGWWKKKQELVARSAMSAAKSVAVVTKAQARGRIRSSWPGMSTRMQNALRVEVYPKGKDAIAPAMTVRHNASYSGVFEGPGTTTISASSLLWIPIPGSPAAKLQRGGAGGAQKLTPAAVSFKLGLPLVPIRRPGKPPILAVKNVRAAKSGKISKGRGNRANAAARKERFLTPLFIGLPSVKIKGKWQLQKLTASEWGRMKNTYTALMRD